MDHLLDSLTGLVGVSIPLVAVTFIFGGETIRKALKSWERRMELQAQCQQKGHTGQSEAVTQELAALRAEVAALRDTSMQFDLSLENNFQRLEQRVSHIEAKTSGSHVPPISQEPVQRVGRQ